MTQTDSRYWRGEGDNLASVRALPQKTFASLAEEVLCSPVILNVTREQYHALPKQERDKVKRVPYIVAARFDTANAPRRTEYATGVSLVTLDIDEASHALPYVTSPETLVDQLAGFNFVLYETASSTKEQPRVRLVVEADLPTAVYPFALKDIAARIGLPNVTRESKPVVQAMYLPTMFRDQGNEEHPVRICVSDQKAYKVEDIQDAKEADDWGVSEEDIEKQFSEVGELEYLKAPLENVTLQDAVSALNHVDPDICYHDWLKIAAALRHQFQQSADHEEAYQIFDEWSSKGSKYQGSEETLAKWKSLKATPFNRMPATIRTVFFEAANNGWDSAFVKAKCFDSCLKWIQTVEMPVSNLASKGISKIAGVPMLTTSEEEGLLQELAGRIKQKGVKVGVPSLRKDLARLRGAHKRKESEKKNVAPQWARGFTYIAALNTFMRTTTREMLSPEAIDRTFSEKLLPSEDDLEKDGKTSLADSLKPIVKPQDYLLNHVRIPRAYDLIYDPQQPNDTFVREEGKVYVNTYTRNYPEPDKVRGPEAARLFLEHMYNLIAEDEYRDTVIDFLAFLVQNPGRKVRWAIIMQGAEGGGKSFISEAMKVVLGKDHVSMVEPKTMSGAWNDWAYGHQLVVLEEVRVVGQNRHEVMNTLKPLITNDNICINQRFRDSRTVPNKANYLLFTNYHDALVLNAGDRRYFVLKSAMQTKEDVEKLGSEYFKKLFGMLKDNAGGLRWFFENHQISRDFDPDGHAPKTTYLQELIDETGGDVSALLHDVIAESSSPFVSKDFVAATMLSDMLSFQKVPVKPQTLAAALREIGYKKAGRLMVNGDRQYVWVKLGGYADMLGAEDYIAENSIQQEILD